MLAYTQIGLRVVNMFLNLLFAEPYALALMCGFVFLALATFFPTKLAFAKGHAFLLSGLGLYVFFFCLHGVDYLPVSADVSSEVYVMARLSVALLNALLLVAAAWHLRQKENVPPSLLFYIMTVVLFSAAWFMFVDKQLVYVRYLEEVLLLAGLFVVFLAFVSVMKWGNILAAVAVFLIGGVQVCRVLGADFSYAVPALGIVFLAFADMLMRIEELSENLKNARESLEKTVFNVENLPLPTFIIGLQNREILFANKGALQMFRLSQNTLKHYHLSDFFADEKAYAQLENQLKTAQQVLDYEVLVKTADESLPFWASGSFSLMPYGEQKVVYAIFEDVMVRKKLESLMQSVSERDPLTSLYNRRSFEQKAEEVISKHKRTHQPFAVLMFDVDHLKNINDSYGHKVGDKVLMEVATICERTFRHEDVLARFGGDEFVVLLSQVTPDAAEIAAQRLRFNVEHNSVLTEDGDEIKLTVSIGVAPFAPRHSLEALLEMADEALYASKNKGRNVVTLYEASQKGKAPKNRAKDDTHPIFRDEKIEEISLLDEPSLTNLPEE